MINSGLPQKELRRLLRREIESMIGSIKKSRFPNASRYVVNLIIGWFTYNQNPELREFIPGLSICENKESFFPNFAI